MFAPGRKKGPAVMGLHDLDVRLGEDARRLLCQRAQQGHAHGHVARAEDGDLLRGLGNGGQLLGGVAGGGDHHGQLP